MTLGINSDQLMNRIHHLRRPGCHGHFRDCRPMALRHRLLPVLPLSVWMWLCTIC